MLLLASFGYYKLLHFKLFYVFLVILNYFIFGNFQSCEIIIGYFWLLKVISPYVIIGYSMLYYHRIFKAILLVVIVGYFIGYYWCLSILLVVIGLVAIVGY